MTPAMHLQALDGATKLVAEYAGSDASRATVTLIDVLLLGYASDLEEVKPDGLAKLQGQIAQLRRMRDVLTGVPHAYARI